MSKKNYLEPLTEVVPIGLECDLLTGSVNGVGLGEDLTGTDIGGSFDDLFN